MLKLHWQLITLKKKFPINCLALCSRRTDAIFISPINDIGGEATMAEGQQENRLDGYQFYFHRTGFAGAIIGAVPAEDSSWNLLMIQLSSVSPGERPWLGRKSDFDR